MPVRQRPSGKWSWYFDMAPVAGKRQRKEKGGYKTKAEAEKALIQFKEQYETCGKVTIETDMSVSDFMDYFYQNYSDINLAYNTKINVHRNSIDNHIKPAIGHYKLKSVTPKILQDFFTNLYKRGYKKESLKKVYGVLSKSFSMGLYPWEFIRFNPMKYVTLRDYRYDENRELVIISKEDFNRVSNYYKETDNYFYIVINLCYHTGMRRGEALALKYNDIDLDNKIIHIRHSITYMKNGTWELKSPKTYSSYRSIAIGETLCDIIREHKSKMKLMHPNQDFICAKLSNGKMITIHDTKYMNRRTREIFGIDFSLHSLRHTHASMLLACGVSMKIVSEKLGHNNISTTMDIYTHVSKKLERDSVNLFESML